jgi:hypothetical protein
VAVFHKAQANLHQAFWHPDFQFSLATTADGESAYVRKGVTTLSAIEASV